jgi:Leucine-rich repeat (LRR) protein
VTERELLDLIARVRDELEQLTNLKDLDLSYNCIKFIPNSLEKLAKLTGVKIRLVSNPMEIEHINLDLPLDN